MVNVVMKVQHDEDSGNVGYWALDNYAKTVIVWANSAPNLYCALETYSGTWTTFSGGSLSPQNGVAQQASGSGRMTGAYVFTFTAPTITPTKPMQGNIGTYDFGGTPADIQLGTYALQTGPTAAHVFSFYFGPFTSENDYQWSWMYTNGKGVGYGNMWVNSLAGSFGDIVISTLTFTPTPVIPPECLTVLPTGWSATPLVNSIMNVKADEDAGNVGYWALDNYLHGQIIWSNTAGTYCALVQYGGTWNTFTYASSPQSQTAESHSGAGTTVSGYVATFTGDYAPMFKATGTIGTFNDGGTKSDILTTPLSNQMGDATYVSYLRLYFDTHAAFNWLSVSYFYTYGSGAGYGNLFLSSPIANQNAGDIVL